MFKTSQRIFTGSIVTLGMSSTYDLVRDPDGVYRKFLLQKSV